MKKPNGSVMSTALRWMAPPHAAASGNPRSQIRNPKSALLILALALASTLQACSAEKAAREDLGRKVKLTILVDKVMQPVAGWVTKEWMIKEAAEAAFNVFSPRSGYDRLDEVKQVADWCRKYGIYHMPWMRGTLAVEEGAKADGKRLVWANGGEQPLWSPNSDEFWEWTTKYVLEYARVSAKNEHLMGVFLDYENYAPGKQGNCYELSYDDLILGKFAKAKGLELPNLEFGKRKAWLEEKSVHEEFAKFQIEHWRERCRTLRQAVNQLDPRFQFCIYPAPGTRFMVEAAYPEWSTKAAPIILGDPWTYGRPSRFLPQEQSLEANRKILLDGLAIPKAKGIPFIYTGGIDPAVQGADPEFSGKNAVMCSETTDGYWIFYEGPKYETTHKEYWKWFTWANRAIAAGKLAAWHEARETEEDWSLALFKAAGKGASLVPPESTGKKCEFPAVQLRGENMLLLGCKKGQPVEVVLRNHPVGKVESLLMWDLRSPRSAKVANGKIAHAQQGPVSFTPDEDGVYLLGASSGRCAFAVVSANVPVAISTMGSMRLLFGTERLYFAVPAGLEQFTVRSSGQGGETVRITVYDPEGKQVATGQTSAKASSTTLTVPAGAHAGKTWSLSLTKADEGTLEDNSLSLDAKLPPALSFQADQVFALVRGK